MRSIVVRLMDKILHDPKDPKLWELWYIPYNGLCRIYIIHRSSSCGYFDKMHQVLVIVRPQPRLRGQV